jgi:HAD superfamily hydrolase (TIGR01459 family)
MAQHSDTPVCTTLTGPVTTSRAWICDIWGVIHNGVAAYPAAVAACRAFRADGGRIVLVTNAPRPAAGVVAQLDVLGVPHDAYDAVLTSGDVTRTMLDAWVGVPTLHIGPQRDLGLFEGKRVPLVDAVGASRVLCSGLYDDTMETPEDYRVMLSGLARRKVPMLCANPDLKVDRGGKIIYCGGAVAALYAELGGAVTYAGKPYAPIYDAACALIDKTAGETVPRADILAIGDGVLTDIPGGIAGGFRTVYISSAIHLDAPLTSKAVTRLFPDPAARPTVAMSVLRYGEG